MRRIKTLRKAIALNGGMPSRVAEVAANFDAKVERAIEAVKRGERIRNTLGDVMVNDLIDYRRMCNMIANSQFRQAANFVQSLDTAAQEEVPSTVWAWLDEQ